MEPVLHTPHYPEKSVTEENFERDSLKFQKELQTILQLQFTPATIVTFYEDALSKLTTLLEESITTYLTAHPKNTLTGKALEDEVMTYYKLDSVNDILISVSERIDFINDIQRHIIKMSDFSPLVFTAPSPDDTYLVAGSGKGFEEKKLVPRLVTLGYILEHDLGLSLTNPDEVTLVRGEVTSEMVRKHPYVRVTIPPLNRTVYICDEEGNMTFIFDTKRILEYVGHIELLDVMEKFRYKEIMAHNPSVGAELRQGEHWRRKMNQLLTEDLEGVNKLKRDIAEKEEKHSDFEKLIPKRRDGWESARSLEILTHANREIFRELVESFRTTHKEWFEKQKNYSVVTEYYHPDLVAKIIKALPEAPSGQKDGWENPNALRERLKLDRRTLASYVETYRNVHPEWFENQKGYSMVVEHYHPDLVAKVLEYFGATPHKRDGWESARSLGGEIKISPKTIKKFVDTYREAHREWFEEQKTASKKTEHYHPNLVALIKEHFKKEE